MARRLDWRSLVLLGTAAGVVCLSTFANLASGADRIESRRPAGRIAVVRPKLAPALNLAAGDRAQRILDLKTGGRSRVKLTVSARGIPAKGSLVDRELGVRLVIDRCAKAWKHSGRVYRCRGKTTRVLADGPVLGTHVVRRLVRRRANHLRLTLTLPQSAPNALQGQTARLVYKFR